MTQVILDNETPSTLGFPMMLKVMTDEETCEYHMKKLYELSKPKPGEYEFRVDGTVWKNGELIAERPDESQEEWINQRMKGSARSWQRWFVGLYFTEEQKKELGITDEAIAGRGMR